MKRRRKKQLENEEAMELGEVLEPYDGQPWADETPVEEAFYEDQPQEDDLEAYVEGESDFYGEEYSEEHVLADQESRFHIAMGMFDLISIIIGVAVILVLASMLITLFNWLKNDILHSALLLQSGLH